jgi:hypothetical protein
MLGAEVTMLVPLRLLCRELHRLLEVGEHCDLPPRSRPESLLSLVEVAVLLMDRLPADTELLRDRLPRPTAPPRPLHVKRLQYLEQPRERRDRGQTVSGIPTGRVPHQCDHLLLLGNSHLVKTS